MLEVVSHSAATNSYGGRVLKAGWKALQIKCLESAFLRSGCPFMIPTGKPAFPICIGCYPHVLFEKGCEIALAGITNVQGYGCNGFPGIFNEFLTSLNAHLIQPLAKGRPCFSTKQATQVRFVQSQLLSYLM